MHPLHGEVRCSPSTWSIMLPPEALGAPPGMTVQEALALGGTLEHFTSKFAAALGLTPSATMVELTPGELQVLSIARALLRDPAVLVLVRPFAYMVPRQRAAFQQLLRVWQMGGMPEIMDCFDEKGRAKAADAAAVSAARASKGARTLVVTAEDMDPEPDAGGVDSNAADVFVDLSSVLELTEVLQATTQARRQQSLQEAEEALKQSQISQSQVRACCREGSSTGDSG
mmetsp:Transcript_119592/g.232847  ORF Transcript_119592/g.232847 Transcript_119592/m.232847 type:complete len:228 (-) Transcript_119592:82-765(-)